MLEGGASMVVDEYGWRRSKVIDETRFVMWGCG